MSTTNQNGGSARRILGTLVLAALMEQLPWAGWALALRPDFVLVAVLYWALHQPNRVGFGVAFFFGLLADFQDGAVFGQYAIPYVIGIYMVQFLRLRLLQFDPFRQSAQMFPILLTVQLLVLLVGWLAVNPPASLMLLLPAFSSTVLWFGVAAILCVWHGRSFRDQA